MSEPRRTPREAESRAPRDGAGDVPGWRDRRSTQQPRGGRHPLAEDAPAGPEAGAAADWERLRSAATGGSGGPTPPPDGPPSLASLLMLLEALRGMVPKDLERQFTALVREALLTLRALIDWYLERLDGGSRERRVEDIPID